MAGCIHSSLDPMGLLHTSDSRGRTVSAVALSADAGGRDADRQRRQRIAHSARFGFGSVPGVILIGVIAAIAYQLVQLVHAIFNRVGRGQIILEGFRAALGDVTDRLVTYFIAVLALLIMYPYIPGSNSPAFQGIGLFVGALISLGSTGLVGNALSGIILTYMDGYQVGDFIEVGDIKGRVSQMALMTTQINKANHEVVTLPNAIVMGHAMVNHSSHRDKGHVVALTVSIGYDTAWRLVETLLEKAAEMTSGVNLKAGVTVLTLSLDQFSIAYELHVYIAEGESTRCSRGSSTRWSNWRILRGSSAVPEGVHRDVVLVLAVLAVEQLRARRRPAPCRRAS